jgi:hypothetical protein
MNLFQSIGGLFQGQAKPQVAQAQGAGAPSVNIPNLFKEGMTAFARGYAPLQMREAEQHQLQMEQQRLQAQEYQMRVAEAKRKAEQEARKAELEQNRARIAAGQYVDNPAFSGQMQRPQAMQPQMMPQAQNQAPMQPQVPEGATQLPDGRIMDASGAEVMPVNSQRMRPQAPVQRFNEYEHNLNIARQLFQAGDSEGAQSYFEQAQKAKMADDARQSQMFSAGIAPANMVQDNPATPNVNERFEAFDPVFRQLKMLGYEVNPQLQEQLIQNPQLAQFLINQGSLPDAAKQSIETQGAFNKPMPFQFERMGDRVTPLDPRTGLPVDTYLRDKDGKVIGIKPEYRINESPDNIADNRSAERREAMGNATQERVAAANRSYQMYATNVRARIARGQLSVAEGNLELRKRQMELGLPVDAEVGDSSSITWDN